MELNLDVQTLIAVFRRLNRREERPENASEPIFTK